MKFHCMWFSSIIFCTLLMCHLQKKKKMKETLFLSQKRKKNSNNTKNNEKKEQSIFVSVSIVEHYSYRLLSFDLNPYIFAFIFWKYLQSFTATNVAMNIPNLETKTINRDRDREREKEWVAVKKDQMQFSWLEFE